MNKVNNNNFKEGFNRNTNTEFLPNGKFESKCIYNHISYAATGNDEQESRINLFEKIIDAVEAPDVQEGEFEALLRRHGIFEYDVRMNVVIDELRTQWQSQHSYTEADLKAAWQAGNDFGNECHCGECDYCIDVKYGEAQPFDVWVKTYPKQVAPIYSTNEVLAIIEQVKVKCADEATVFLPSHYALHGTKNIDKKSITDIDFKYLLK